MGKGSGVAAELQPCASEFMQTKDYYDICVKHGFTDSCIPNSFFPNANAMPPAWAKPTSELTGDCSSGYCPCPLSKTYKMAMDNDWPPYAFGTATLPEGIGADIARGMDALEGACSGMDFEVVVTDWAECWKSAGGGTIGDSLNNGTFDACMTYTHTKGVRSDQCEFGHPILADNKPAGLLTLLVDGVPKVKGFDDLRGKTIVDVGGWEPTADGFRLVENKCTGQMYHADATLIKPSVDGNDAAMQMLRDGSADAMFVYADQAINYQCPDNGAWNCSLWSGLGTEYAYVQTGQTGYLANGTTLVMAKKGSGVAAELNLCLVEFMQTRDYYDVCEKHGFTSDCFPNSHFPNADSAPPSWSKPTSELTGDCSSGYCSCPHGGTCGQKSVRISVDDLRIWRKTVG